MNPLYEWLYENYAKPQLADRQLSSVYQLQRQEWQTTAEQLPRRERLLSEDLMATLKNDWGIISFACGVRFGLRLAADLFGQEEL
ncbi:MAG: hypothetical protein HFF20_10225 [Oscillospiraceae bacterium]|nr:hypothetical protein [Oscillospiraceae bacterium]MCI9549576.1 hypothetical protein [Oscillospiraceae bacterium]